MWGPSGPTRPTLLPCSLGPVNKSVVWWVLGMRRSHLEVTLLVASCFSPVRASTFKRESAKQAQRGTGAAQGPPAVGVSRAAGRSDLGPAFSLAVLSWRPHLLAPGHRSPAGPASLQSAVPPFLGGWGAGRALEVRHIVSPCCGNPVSLSPQRGGPAPGQGECFRFPEPAGVPALAWAPAGILLGGGPGAGGPKAKSWQYGPHPALWDASLNFLDLGPSFPCQPGQSDF